MAKDKSLRELTGLTVKIDVDVSEAIRGLKALTRETKRATAALKEAEQTAARIHGNISVTSPADVDRIAAELAKKIDEIATKPMHYEEGGV